MPVKITIDDVTISVDSSLTEALTTIVAALRIEVKTQGEKVMGKVEEISKNLDDLRQLIIDHDATHGTDKAEIARLIAEAAISQAAKDALQAEIDAVWAKSEALEAEQRAKVPGAPLPPDPIPVPPI